METKALRIRNVIFWALVVIFAALVGGIVNRWRLWGHGMPFWGFAAIAIILCTLSAVLVVLTVKLKEQGLRKWFFMITGISAAGIPIFAILHNVIYGLLILLFGKEFWGKGGDEPVFFILAVIVCPVLFIIGTLGSIVLFITGRMKKRLEC